MKPIVISSLGLLAILYLSLAAWNVFYASQAFSECTQLNKSFPCFDPSGIFAQAGSLVFVSTFIFAYLVFKVGKTLTFLIKKRQLGSQ
jgi:hypothetical protein